MKVVNFTQIKDELINNMRRKMLIPVIGSGFTRGCDAYKGKVPSGKDYSEYMISKIAAQLSLEQAEIDSLKRDSFSNVSDIYHRAIPISSQKEYLKFKFIYSILYKPCIFKAYRLLNVQTLCIFPCFCPYEPKQGKFLFSADYLIQQSCGSTLRFPCSVSVNVHCGTDISVSEKFLHIFRCCTV